MASTVTISHNFETAHRLPHLPGKCVSLHGHSWWAEVTVTAPAPDAAGVVVEFGPFKKMLRGWIDEHLDHGVMLGAADPLVPLLREHDCKVYEMPDGWPTVENVAARLADVASELLAELDHVPGARVAQVDVRETHVNRAGWTA
ncbi:6-pyruvoyl tetrahydropterin synthase family protein [Amycolatopsis sp. cg5]|uniref:6-pyruvoyl trahydropterin synthase family protein n=1 Tax=Amycolatopsis sp. cg5 TaxID=3238802 RepID=UPI0035268200